MSPLRTCISAMRSLFHSAIVAFLSCSSWVTNVFLGMRLEINCAMFLKIQTGMISQRNKQSEPQIMMDSMNVRTQQKTASQFAQPPWFGALWLRVPVSDTCEKDCRSCLVMPALHAQKDSDHLRKYKSHRTEPGRHHVRTSRSKPFQNLGTGPFASSLAVQRAPLWHLARLPGHQEVGPQVMTSGLVSMVAASVFGVEAFAKRPETFHDQEPQI